MKKPDRKWLDEVGFNKNSGFTLVEVISSFAVLAIVSVALMQMFVLSTKTNNNAFDMDKANALCIDMSELYKANPVSNIIKSSGDFAVSSSTSGTTLYTRYYNRDWNISNEPDGQIFMLQIEEEPSSTTRTAISIHPEFAWTAALDTSAVFTLNVSSTGSDCNVKLNSTDSPATFINKTRGDSSTSGTAIIPIQLDCKNVSSNLEINVTNTAQFKYPGTEEELKTIADLYLCDIPTGSTITVNPLEGMVSYSSIVTGNSNDRLYSAQVRVIRLNDGFKMVENNVVKYMEIED